MGSDFDDEVVFLDLDGSTGHGTAANGDGAEPDIDWLDEPAGEERVTAGRDPRALPRRATRGRALASVLSLALVLSAAGGAGLAAYHRHRTDVRIAETLRLAASSVPPNIPGLTELAFAARWQAHPAEQVLIPVVNRGPVPVTLVDGALTESDLRGTPRLEPVGEATIPPGGTGELAGTVTADCVTAQYSAIATPAVEAGQGAAGGGEGVHSGEVTINGFSEGVSLLQAQKSASADTLRVRARAADGHLSVQTIRPESGLTDTAQRICAQQGQTVAHTSGMKTAVDPRRHTITLTMTETSTADSPLQYSSNAAFDAAPVAPDLKMDDYFTSLGPGGGAVAGGEVGPGGTFTVAFRLTIQQCPSTTTFDDNEIVLGTMLILDKEPVAAQTYTAGVRPLIAEACGHPADWKGY